MTTPGAQTRGPPTNITWIPNSINQTLQKLVESGQLRPPETFFAPTPPTNPWLQLRPEHVNAMTDKELYAILKQAQNQNIIKITGFPTDSEKCTREELLGEVCGFFTAWSPYTPDFNSSPYMRQYSAQANRYYRQRVIHVYRGSQTGIEVPWGNNFEKFLNRKIVDYYNEAKDRKLIQDATLAANSTAPTNIILYFASQTHWGSKAIENLPNINKVLPTNPITRYTMPPDISCNRLATFMSGLRRVRLSSRIDEQLITSIGCSFFVQETHDAIPLHRARYNEPDIAPVLEVINREYQRYPTKIQIRLRLVGLRPQQIAKDGMSPYVIKEPETQCESGQLVTLTNLPDGDLVNEIRDHWSVFPFVMAPHYNYTEATTNVALWIFGTKVFTPTAIDEAQKNKTVDKFTVIKDGTLSVSPPEHPHDAWRSKLVYCTSKKTIPLVDSVGLPHFVTKLLIDNKALQMECAYRDASRANVNQMNMERNNNKTTANVRDWKPPHPFRGAILAEVVRKLSPDDMCNIVLNKPPLDIPTPSQPVEARCPVCNKTDKLLRCAQCKQVSYCSVEHQRENWLAHKGYCKQRWLEMKKEESKNATKDDDIASGVVSVSLECPLTGERCDIPARSLYCKHSRCFDLRSWLKYQLDDGTKANSCPVCSLPVHLDDLRLSKRIQIACTTLPAHVVEVVLGENDLYEAKLRGHQLYKDKGAAAAVKVVAASIDSDDDDDDDDEGSDGDIPLHLQKKMKPNSAAPTTTTATKTTTAGDDQQLVQLPPPNTTNNNINNNNNNNNNNTMPDPALYSNQPNPATRPRPPPPPPPPATTTAPAAAPAPAPADDVIELD